MSVNLGATAGSNVSKAPSMAPSLGTITPSVGCRSSCGNQVCARIHFIMIAARLASGLPEHVRESRQSGYAASWMRSEEVKCRCTQVKSTVPSRPSYGFGSSTREDRAKRFISDAHTSKETAKFTPGPGAYSHKVSDLFARAPDLFEKYLASRLPPSAGGSDSRPAGADHTEAGRIDDPYVPTMGLRHAVSVRV